jgi:hypothetical protein
MIDFLNIVYIIIISEVYLIAKSTMMSFYLNIGL